MFWSANEFFKILLRMLNGSVLFLGWDYLFVSQYHFLAQHSQKKVCSFLFEIFSKPIICFWGWNQYQKKHKDFCKNKFLWKQLIWLDDPKFFKGLWNIFGNIPNILNIFWFWSFHFLDFFIFNMTELKLLCLIAFWFFFDHFHYSRVEMFVTFFH